MNGRFGFAALLAVIGASIVFGMVLGGRLNAPEAAFAAKPAGALFDASARAVEPPAGAAGVDFSEIAEHAIPAVVRITSTIESGRGGPGGDDDEVAPEDLFRYFFGPNDPHHRMDRRAPRERVESGGSGFIVSGDGYILTNNHVVAEATKVVVTLESGDKLDATVVGKDSTIDLALLKVDAKGRKLPTLVLGDSDALRPGNWVVAIGNPLELYSTVTVGVVSATRRRVAIGDTIPGIANFIQTDAAINFGNSGGPLLNIKGEVVGINTAILRGDTMNRPLIEGIGFALPINEARLAAEQLRDGGAVKRGYLGIAMSSSGVNDAARRYLDLPDANGVVVAGVQPDGPSAKAGLKKDDVIRRVNGAKIADNQDLLARVAALRPGDTAVLEVWRDAKTTEIRVILDARPTERADANGPSRRRGPQDEQETDESEALGIKVEALTPSWRGRLQLSDASSGVVVVAVDPSSQAAENDSLRAGRLIVAVNGAPVRSLRDWTAATGAIKPGGAVKLELALNEGTEPVFLVAPEPEAAR